MNWRKFVFLGSGWAPLLVRPRPASVLHCAVAFPCCVPEKPWEKNVKRAFRLHGGPHMEKINAKPKEKTQCFNDIMHCMSYRNAYKRETQQKTHCFNVIIVCHIVAHMSIHSSSEARTYDHQFRQPHMEEKNAKTQRYRYCFNALTYAPRYEIQL